MRKTEEPVHIHKKLIASGNLKRREISMLVVHHRRKDIHIVLQSRLHQAGQTPKSGLPVAHVSAKSQKYTEGINIRNFQEKKNKMKASIARPLITGDNTLYAKAIVANNDRLGKTVPKFAWNETEFSCQHNIFTKGRSHFRHKERDGVGLTRSPSQEPLLDKMHQQCADLQ